LFRRTRAATSFLTTRAPILFLALTLAVRVHAYDHPLSADAIREAYFLGQRSDQKVKDFLDQYTKHPPMPEQGPYISGISFFTPYEEVVLRSWRQKIGYSAQQAEQDYRSQGDTIRVRVIIEFTATYNAMQGAKPSQTVAGEKALLLRPQDFWREFQFELSQTGKKIEPRDIRGAPIYSRGFRGAEVWLDYETKSIASKETVVEVLTPDNHRVTVRFDLALLR